MAWETTYVFLRFLNFFSKSKKHDFLRFFDSVVVLVLVLVLRSP